MEERIRKLLKEQPEKGLELAMKQYGGLCWSIVSNQLSGIGTKEDIEDCVSEAFAALYEGRQKLDGQKGTVKAYLAVIAKRRAIDCYHRLKSSPSGEMNLLQQEKECVVESEAGTIADRETLLWALKELGEPDTQIFLRKYYLGQSTKEIAASLDIKENTIDKKVQRGLAKLRRLLEGGECV